MVTLMSIISKMRATFRAETGLEPGVIRISKKALEKLVDEIPSLPKDKRSRQERLKEVQDGGMALFGMRVDVYESRANQHSVGIEIQ